MYGASIVAKNVANKGVYRSRKAPVAPKSSYKEPSYSLSTLIDNSKRVFALIKEIDSKEIFSKLFRFNKQAKRCIIYEPSYSVKYNNKTEINAITHVDNNGKTSYIYPGESFWKVDGLCQQTMSTDTDIETLTNCTYTGAAKLNVLPSSVIEKED